VIDRHYLCGFFGGSLYTNSGLRSSINSRIGSEMASMRSKSKNFLVYTLDFV
jgi:hypothetical protein